MDNNILITIIVATLGSSALFEFFRYLISRRDSKSDKYIEIITEIAGLRKDIVELHGDVDKIEAINARIRILEASDEIRMRVKHSEEWFNQVNEDITTYQRYCKKNPEFQNNRAVHAIENVNDAYKHALSTNDFL